MTHMKVRNSNLLPDVFSMMDRFLSDDFQTGFISVKPSVNILEGENAYTLELMAPGLQKHDFKIAVDKNLLTISYEKKESQEENKENYVRREFSFQSFKRTFTLNENLNTDGIEAKYENGILYVTLPKVEQKTIEVKTVAVN
jgi:Molecular chaperone (small heat shock protein)